MKFWHCQHWKGYSRCLILWEQVHFVGYVSMWCFFLLLLTSCFFQSKEWLLNIQSMLTGALCLCLYRGFVYCRNEELEPGWLVFSSGRLLHRPSSFDAKPHQLCQVIDPFTLQVLYTIVHYFNFEVISFTRPVIVRLEAILFYQH